MVIPERVALERIHLLPPAGRGDRGGARRRRELLRPREAAGEALLLRLPSAGTELDVHLRRDLRFLSRGFVVEHRRGEERRPPAERLCFYTGRVLNRSDSFASLSTCAGLVLPPRPAPALKDPSAPRRFPSPASSPLPSADPEGFPVGTDPSPPFPFPPPRMREVPRRPLTSAPLSRLPLLCPARPVRLPGPWSAPLSPRRFSCQLRAREPPCLAEAGKVSRITSARAPLLLSRGLC